MTNSQRPDTAHPAVDIPLLIALSSLYLLWRLGFGSLASWDEAYYAILSADIVRTGDWIHLRALGVDCYDKPPLYFWITAIFYHLWGAGEFTTRLGSALSGCGLVVGTYALGRRLISREAALTGAILLLTSKDFIHYSRFGTLDVMNLCWMTAAAVNGVAALDASMGPKGRSIRWLGFWVFSALAVMTKGPLILVVWAVLAAWAMATGRSFFWRSKAFFLGAGFFALLVIPWHWAAWAHNPEKFTQDFLIKHYLARTGQAVEGHAGEWHYYLRKVLINKHKPWFVLEAIAWVAALTVCVRRKVGSAGLALLVLWAAAFVGIFSLAVRTKLPWYVMPAYPALTLLAGWGVARVAAGRTRFVLWIAAALVPFTYLSSTSAFWHDHAPTIRALSAEVGRRVSEDQLVHLYNFHEQPAANFYWRRRVAYLDSTEEFAAALDSKTVTAVAVRSEDASVIEPALKSAGFARIVTTSESGDALSLWLLNAPSV